MPFEFRLPDLGEGIEEAQVLAWKVRPGQQVAAFAPLCEVESAKAAVELTSPVGGRVRETRVAEGETAHRGEVLVVIDTAPVAPGQAAPDQSAPAEAARPGAGPGRAGGLAPHQAAPGVAGDEWFGIVGTPPRPPAERAVPAPAQAPLGTQAGSTMHAPAESSSVQAPAGARLEARRVLAAPFVRRLAKELNVRLEGMAGSGPRGRIRVADVEAAASRRAQASADVRGASARDVAEAEDEVIPLRGLRKAIAEHMLEAVRHAPQVTSMDLFDVSELVRAREALLDSANAAGVRLSYLPFFVKAAVQALRAVPTANAVLDEAAGAIRLKKQVNVGIATAVPGGLVVPVVKGADRLSVLEIAAEIERLVGAARERRSRPSDLADGTFTITSFGGLPGSPLFATPILNYPEVAILGIGRIDLQPRVVEGQVVARYCAGVSLTFDHRVLDGEGAGQFMAVLKQYLEQPMQLVLHLR